MRETAVFAQLLTGIGAVAGGWRKLGGEAKRLFVIHIASNSVIIEHELF